MSKSVMDVLETGKSFRTLASAIKQADLEKTLRQPGPFTIFAPTEDAIDALPDKKFASWQSDPSKLAKVLKYHVVAGRLSAADLLERRFVKTIEGQSLHITSKLDEVGEAETAVADSSGYVMGGTVTAAIVQTIKVNGAAILQPDMEADNGFVHAIDHVEVPKPL